jgi:aminocarboxymuconate-semialdehyde decarboxylase
MPNRRAFLKNMSCVTGAILSSSGIAEAAARSFPSGTGRRQVIIGGRPVKTIDIHGHCLVREVFPLVQDYAWATPLKTAMEGTRGRRLTPDFVGPERVRFMDEHGIDVQALSINPYWYTAERDLATRFIAAQNEALAAACANYPGRFVGLATVALQYPDLAARQLEDAIKKLGMSGVAIAANIAGEELSSPKHDPFWAKAQELGAFIFVHPQLEGGFEGKNYPAGMYKRFSGFGNLDNVIGYPLETSIAFAHLIFEGTLDRFPGLRICGAHGGGFLPSYIGRADASCEWLPQNCRALKRKPGEYFKEQLFCDSLVFNAEELRLRVAQYGAGQVVLGTDHPAPWPTKGVDHVLETQGVSDAAKIAMLGGNLAKLLRIPY